MKKQLLSKLSAETFSQMAADENISNNFSEGLTKKFLSLGATTVLAGMMFLSSGVAHADDTRNVAVGLSGLFGFLSSGSTPKDIPSNCYVQGTSGLQNGVSGAIGAVAGNQIGGGRGKQVMTVIGAVAGVAASQSIENERMRKECAAQIAHANRVDGIPMYATNNSSPQSPILYEGTTINGKSFYVTMQDSPGIAGLAGKIPNGANVDSDGIVKSALDRGSRNLEIAYEELDREAKEYKQVTSGRTTIAKLSRYAVDANDVGANSELNRTYQNILAQAKQEFDQAYNQYAQKRSIFANVADNAVIDGFNISRYGNSLKHFVPPESATVTYSGKLSNQYAVINSPARP